MPLAQLLEDQVLGKISILIFIDHEVVEPRSYFLFRLGEVAQEDIHVQKNVVEVHHARRTAFPGVEGIHVAGIRHPGLPVGFHKFRIVPVGLRCHEIVLCEGYPCLDRLRLVDLVIKLELLQTGLDGAERVARVVDCELRRIAELFGIVAQESYEYRVEGPHHYAPRLAAAYHEGDSFLHLRCCFLGECQCHHPGRVHPFLQNPGNPAGKDSGLS